MIKRVLPFFLLVACLAASAVVQAAELIHARKSD